MQWIAIDTKLWNCWTGLIQRSCTFDCWCNINFRYTELSSTYWSRLLTYQSRWQVPVGCLHLTNDGRSMALATQILSWSGEHVSWNIYNPETRPNYETNFQGTIVMIFRFLARDWMIMLWCLFRICEYWNMIKCICDCPLNVKQTRCPWCFRWNIMWCEQNSNHRVCDCKVLM